MGVMSVSYTTINGEIVSENRNGVPSDYIPDALGSTIALLSDTHQITDSWTYWPNGQVRTRTGTNPTPHTFCGTVGYHSDLVDNLTYVRARLLRPGLARWQTVDPLWPVQLAYTYAAGSPTTFFDRLGLEVLCLQTCAPCMECVGVGNCGSCGLNEECWKNCIIDQLLQMTLKQAAQCLKSCAHCLFCIDQERRRHSSSGGGGKMMSCTCSAMETGEECTCRGKISCGGSFQWPDGDFEGARRYRQNADCGQATPGCHIHHKNASCTRTK
jgi:RHS repeat-associated protein